MIPLLDGLLGGGSLTDDYWFRVAWSFTEPAPTGLAQGFEVVIYTGTDPTDSTKYLEKIASVGIDTRVFVTCASVAKGKTLPGPWLAAVRVVYPWAKGAWTAATVSATLSAPSGATLPIIDNLFPNPTSELGSVAMGYAAALLVNDGTNSYAGNWCRKLDTSATNKTALTDKLACVYGDQVSYSAWIKMSAAGPAAQLVLDFYNASGTNVGTATSTAYTATSYAYSSIQGTVPSGAVYCIASVQASATGAGTFAYFDNFSLRRSINFGHITSDGGFRLLNAVKNTGATVNDRAWYAGNNDPTVLGGAPNIATLTVTRRRWDTTNHIGRLELKLQPSAASDNLDGMRPAKVQWYQQSGLSVQSVSIPAGQVVVAGSPSKTFTRSDAGGSFLTDGFAVGQTVQWSGFVNSSNNANVIISALSATVMTCATASLSNETSTAATQCTGKVSLSSIDTTYPAIHDRLFANSTDSNSANASINTALLQDSGINAGYPACLVTLYNAFGPSDTHCFYSAAGNADGSVLTDNGTSFPTTFTGAPLGGTGGGSGSGGGCPEVSVLIDMADGTQKRADAIQVGDLVWTMDPNTGTVGQWPVTDSVTEAVDELWTVAFADGRAMAFKERHRLRLLAGGWCEVQDLQGGMQIDGTRPGTIQSVAFFGPGSVQRITVDQVHSYQTSGLLSSNIKPAG